MDIELPGDRGPLPTIVAYLYFGSVREAKETKGQNQFSQINWGQPQTYLGQPGWSLGPDKISFWIRICFSLSVVSFFFLLCCLYIFCSFRWNFQSRNWMECLSRAMTVFVFVFHHHYIVNIHLRSPPQSWEEHILACRTTFFITHIAFSLLLFLIHGPIMRYTDNLLYFQCSKLSEAHCPQAPHGKPLNLNRKAIHGIHGKCWERFLKGLVYDWNFMKYLSLLFEEELLNYPDLWPLYRASLKTFK